MVSTMKYESTSTRSQTLASQYEYEIEYQNNPCNSTSWKLVFMKCYEIKRVRICSLVEKLQFFKTIFLNTLVIFVYFKLL